LLGKWTSSGVLVRERAASLYAYEQAFTWSGRDYRRRAMIAAVRLAEFGEGVWPHEKTFPGPSADRLRLTEATGMQISPVFGFCQDDNVITETLFRAAGNAPVARARLGGVAERLWAVSDAGVAEAIGRALSDRPLFIADGHHRYTTSLKYRNQLRGLDERDPANYVMCVLASVDDPGLIVLPVHRVIHNLRGFDLGRFVYATKKVMDYHQVRFSEDDLADTDAFLRRFGPRAMAFVAPRGPGDPPLAYVGAVKDDSLMAQLAPDHVPAWRRLDVSVLHRMLIDHYLAECKTNEMMIDYVVDGRMAVSAAASGKADLVVLLRATAIESVKKVALAGAVMPHKSTYFYPKPATGMVLYPLR